MSRKKQHQGKPATCEKCGLLDDSFVVVAIIKEESESRMVVCDDCYQAEMAKPVRKWGVQT